MDLLERYLQAIRYFLPRREREDILRELAEDIASEMEDLQQKLGRPLTEDDQAGLLRRRGLPIVVAARFRSAAPLIGPMLLPIYWLTLQIGLAAALVVTLAMGLASALLHGDTGRQALQAMLEYPERALIVFAWTTLCFMGLEAVQGRMKLTANWDPRKLPMVIRPERRISRWRSFCEFAFTSAALVWLLLVPAFPFLVLGPFAAFLELAPAVRSVYALLVLLTLATATVSLLSCIWPCVTAARFAASVVIHSAAFFTFAALLRAGELVVVKPGLVWQGAGSVERVAEVVNASFEIGLAIACVVNLVEVVRDLIRWRAQSNLVAGVAAGN